MTQNQSPSNQVEGVVKSIIGSKNFGFILHDKSEYFFHRADYNGHWDDLVIDFDSGKQIKVHFLPQYTVKGNRANEVSRLDWPNQTA